MFMATQIGEGAKEQGVKVDVKNVEECIPEDLVDYDGIIIGSPTYFSSVCWQIKKLIDETASLRRDGFRLKDKIGGCFTSSDIKVDGEYCIKLLELAFSFHHKMQMIPGIIATRNMSEDEILEMCRIYGANIASKIQQPQSI